VVRVVDELFAAPPREGMVAHFVLGYASELERLAAERRRALLARADEHGREEHVARARARLRQILGLDLLPRSGGISVVDTVDHAGFAVDKLVFEATRGLPVPALVYRPHGSGPFPGVVHAPGHWMEDGKLAGPIQRLNEQLVRMGMVVLCFDPIGQGERRIGWHQHGQLGPLLVGVTTLGAMVAENLFALSVLESMPVVSKTSLAMIGASGGGFTTLFSSALDDRCAASVVSSIVNTNVGQLRDAAFGTGWDGWVDLCNQVPDLFSIGDLGDVLGLIAPRRLLIANAVDDSPFPLAGSRSVRAEVDEYYAALDAREAFRYREIPGGHGWTPAMRGACTDFLAGSFGIDGSVREGVPDAEPMFSALWRVPHHLASAESPQERQEGRSGGLCLDEPVDTNEALVAMALSEVATIRETRPRATRGVVADALGPFPERCPLEVRVSNHVVKGDGESQRVTLCVEPGISIDSVFSLPCNWSDNLPPVLIVVDEGGKHQGYRSAVCQRGLARGWAVFTVDVRGTGESAMSEFEVASGAWMLDRDMLNQRVWDIVRTVDYISGRYSSSQQVDKSRIVLWGNGNFGVVALMAAALDARLRAVGCDGPNSFEDLIYVNSRETPMLYRHGLLRMFDVADLLGVIAPRTACIGSGLVMERFLETVDRL